MSCMCVHPDLDTKHVQQRSQHVCADRRPVWPHDGILTMKKEDAVAAVAVESYLYAPEDSMGVYAVLCAAAVHHGGAGVTFVACCMAANTEKRGVTDLHYSYNKKRKSRHSTLLQSFEQLSQSHVGVKSRQLLNRTFSTPKYQNWKVVCFTKIIFRSEILTGKKKVSTWTTATYSAMNAKQTDIE